MGNSAHLVVGVPLRFDWVTQVKRSGLAGSFDWVTQVSESARYILCSFMDRGTGSRPGRLREYL
ncbi:MAG: hypothetical protein ACFFCZ_30625 [Promethearchaeota archaeon]